MSDLPLSRRDVRPSQTKLFSGSASRFENGDVLFARITPCLENGRTGRVCGLGDGEIGVGSSEFIVMRARRPGDAHFIYYLARFEEFRSYAIRNMTGTSGRQRASWQALAEYEAPTIDPVSRTKIGSTLAALDDKIEVNFELIHAVEATAAAIFRDWFVDFGPVRRKLTSAPDPVQVMGGLALEPIEATRLAALFPEALGEDDLPSGWPRGTASELLEFNPREPLRVGMPAPYSDMSSLPTRGPVAEDPIMRPFNSGMRFRNGDALLARITPCLENGKGAWVDFLADDAPVGWGSTEFIVIRGRPPTPASFGYLLSRHPDFRRHAIQAMTGTSGRQRVQADSLAAWPLAIPPSPVLEAFGRYTDPLFARIAAAAAENRALSETRDYLLPRLISGEVSIGEAQEEISA